MKKVIILSTMFSSLFLFSQVGINNQNPQGILHVDGAKDNPAIGAPNAAQQLNDFTVTNTGDVGIGITTPTSKLDINGGLRVRDIPVGTSGISQIAVDSNGNVVKTPASGSGSTIARGSFLSVGVGTQTIAASDAPAGYPYLKSVTVAGFTSSAKAAITGILVQQNNILACSAIGGSGTNVCSTSLSGGTFTLSTTGTDAGFSINVTNSAFPTTIYNLYYVAEYSKF